MEGLLSMGPTPSSFFYCLTPLTAFQTIFVLPDFPPPSMADGICEWHLIRLYKQMLCYYLHHTLYCSTKTIQAWPFSIILQTDVFLAAALESLSASQPTDYFIVRICKENIKG